MGIVPSRVSGWKLTVYDVKSRSPTRERRSLHRLVFSSLIARTLVGSKTLFGSKTVPDLKEIFVKAKERGPPYVRTRLFNISIRT